jgi:hypothetical protein
VADIAWLKENPLGYVVGEMVAEGKKQIPPVAVYFRPKPKEKPDLKRLVLDGWSNKDHRRICESDKSKCVCIWKNFVTIEVRGEARTMTNRDLDGFYDLSHWEFREEKAVNRNLELNIKTL